MLQTASNPIAILLAVAAYMGLGALWYSSVLFGNRWMKEVGIESKKNPKNSTRGYFGAAICAAISAAGLAQMKLMGYGGTGAYLPSVAIMISLIFIAPTVIPSYIFSGRSRILFLIDFGYQICGLTLMGVILSFFV